MRRALLAAATTVTAVLATTGAANAAPNWSTSTITSTGPYVSGEVATYTLDIVNTGDAGGGTAGTFQLTEDGDPVEVVGTPTKADGPGAGADMSAQVNVAAASNSISILAAFGAGDARITVQVRLPGRFDDQWKVRASGTANTGLNIYDEDRLVAKGGPSYLTVDNLSSYPAIVAKDGTFTARLRVTNRGSGAAELPLLRRSYISGSANPFSPTPPAFNPTATFAAGCATITSAGANCNLATLAAGASVDVDITFAGLTHYGSAYSDFTATAADSDRSVYEYLSVGITDGATTHTGMSLDGPKQAASRTDVTYAGTLVNHGSAALGTSRLVFEVDGFDANGVDTSDPKRQVDSVKSITLSTGAACTKHVDTLAIPNVTYPNRFICPVTSLAVGGRISYTLVANYPTSLPNQDVDVDVDLDSITGTTFDGASAETTLNVDRSVELDLGVQGPAIVGADRITGATLSVKNVGNVQARSVMVRATLPGSKAEFVLDTLPAGCWTYTTARHVDCFVMTLDPGATASWNVRIRTPKDPGNVVVRVSAGDWGAALRDAYFGDWDEMDDAVSFRVVKAVEAPLDGVKDTKLPARNLTQLVNLGLPGTFTCPDSCRVAVQLRVDRALAQRLGLVPRPRPTRRAKAPNYVVIGTAAKSRTGSGTVVVTTKLTRAYKVKVAALRAALPIKRVVTVVSTAADTKDARWTKTSTVTVRPAPRRPRR